MSFKITSIICFLFIIFFLSSCQSDKIIEKKSLIESAKFKTKVDKVNEISIQKSFYIVEGCETYNITEINHYKCITQRPFTLDWELCISKYSHLKLKVIHYHI